MANEDYEDVIFSDFSDFLSEHEKGKAVIDPNIGWSSDPILKINLSRPDPTVATAYPQPRWFPDTKVCASTTLCASVFTLGLLYNMFCDV